MCIWAGGEGVGWGGPYRVVFEKGMIPRLQGNVGFYVGGGGGTVDEDPNNNRHITGRELSDSDLVGGYRTYTPFTS